MAAKPIIPFGRGQHNLSSWVGSNVPAANTQATKTQPSAGPGKRNVCTGFAFSICGSDTTAPTAAQVTCNLIDGASGGSTYLFQFVVAIPATAGFTNGVVDFNGWYIGSSDTAMTIEFSGAGGAHTIESVSFRGTVIEDV